MKKAKKAVGFGAVGVAAVALFLFLRNGNGFGPGNGDGFSNGESDASIQQESQTESTQETAEESKPEESSEELADALVVTIRENKVLVGDKEFDNEADLKAYLEEIHVDSKTYELKEENSIQATYEWVTKVFDDLSIEYTVAAE